ncbi:hypothetical protein ACJ73_06996 [Blastomyces percursus]|uniref:Uncharacterized protein n=1 Tax=Blastomyces percursus TaxID=1658174 RepID=A0A1J9QN75_9EURO|nr:hypothetical protein ACJ73_06996 [Blastomyces percursus]
MSKTTVRRIQPKIMQLMVTLLVGEMVQSWVLRSGAQEYLSVLLAELERERAEIKKDDGVKTRKLRREAREGDVKKQKLWLRARSHQLRLSFYVPAMNYWSRSKS